MGTEQKGVVVSNIFYVHPYLGKISNVIYEYFSDGLKPPTRMGTE